MKITKTTLGSFGIKVKDEVVVIAEGDNEIDDSIWKELKKKLVIQDLISCGAFVIDENDIATEPVFEEVETEGIDYDSLNVGEAIEIIDEINASDEFFDFLQLEREGKNRKTVMDKLLHKADELGIDLEE